MVKINKNIIKLEYQMIFYFAVVVFVYFFGLFKIEFLVNMSNFVASLIPSINKTASISANNDYAKFVLSFSWLLIIPTHISQVANCDHDKIYNKSNIKNLSLLLLSATVFLIGVLLTTIYTVPSNSGGYDRSMFYVITKFTFGITIWGFIIWLVISAFSSALTNIIIVMTQMLFRKKT